jgi:hypothetical protein
MVLHLAKFFEAAELARAKLSEVPAGSNGTPFCHP